MSDNKIVQIIPAAESLVASFSSGGMTIRLDPEKRVVAFGLRQDGTVVPLVAVTGGVADATTLPGFHAITRE